MVSTSRLWNTRGRLSQCSTIATHTHAPFHRLNLNIWDVGGQRSLRSYWRNYFESTDGVVWVVDSADRRRMEDCRTELHSLLVQEVIVDPPPPFFLFPLSPLLSEVWIFHVCFFLQRLAGASLLVFANKQDLPGAMTAQEIRQVSSHSISLSPR